MKARKTFDHRLAVPRQATDGSAGFDLPLAQAVTLEMGQQAKLSTGWAFEIPFGFVGLIKDRSSIAKLRLYTSAGVIDSDYRGEVKILMVNRSTVPIRLEKGELIAQMIVIPYLSTQLELVKDLEETERAAGGFGSTNK